MRQSKLFFKTAKNPPKEAKVSSHKLLLRGDFISQLSSGVYSFLPLGLRVHRKVENIIREEIEKIGSQEIFLPALQPKELWLKSGRWDSMDPPLFKLKDRHKKEFALGSTHEEVVTDLAKNRIQSYKDLPFALYQIQTKFRNEMRFTGGILRAREFMMKDLYSFHKDFQGLEDFFQKVLSAYDNIFKRCLTPALRSEASGGVFTKEKNYEFQVISKAGEDKIIYCPKCSWAANLEVAEIKKGGNCPRCGGKTKEAESIEVAHAFKLGDRYSKSLDLNFIDKNAEKKPVLMGCYGIGVGRLMATIVESNHDKEGIVWPKETAPFDVHLVQLGKDSSAKEKAEKLYRDLQARRIEVLYDDREEKGSGEKLVESDLIGIPLRIVASERSVKKGSFEVAERAGKTRLIKFNKVLDVIKSC
jgi:prolyl-tRNA synthetase